MDAEIECGWHAVGTRAPDRQERGYFDGEIVDVERIRANT